MSEYILIQGKYKNYIGFSWDESSVHVNGPVKWNVSDEF